MSKKYIIDSDENSDYMYNVIKSIIEEAGPRPPCSEGERKGSEWAQKELRKFCDKVEWEDFYCRPRSFLGFIKYIFLVVATSVFIFIFSDSDPITKIVLSVISLGPGLFGVLIFYKSFLCYEEFLWPLFKKRKSQNIIGTFSPTNEVKKRIIFCGHIDSTIYNHFQYLQHGYLYALVMGVFPIFFYPILYSFQLINGFIGQEFVVFGIIFNILVIGLPGFLAIIMLVIGPKTGAVLNIFGQMSKRGFIAILGMVIYSYIIDFMYIFLVTRFTLVDAAILELLNLLPCVPGLILFQSRKASPGALDNLTAVAICHCIAKILHDWKVQKHADFPKNTEIKILICGCEEAGLKGSQAFAERHAEEYNKIETLGVNFETIANSKEVKIYTREDTIRQELDKEIAYDLAACAEKLNLNYKITTMPFISGAIDSAGLMRGGIRASSLEGFHYEDYCWNYHSTRDNLDMVNKKRRPNEDCGTRWNNRNVRGAMENALKISLEYIKLINNR